ncbi:MAG TPA: response regulator [Dehalococcoidia bacterium]|nr:response regulator [Dehalococcoidia bacterium]HIL31663.1 response regulator [Dehalococcoidia bacterium]
MGAGCLAAFCPKTQAGEAHPIETITVLLVNYDRPLLEFFSTVLRREGYTVLIAQNGLEALNLVKAQLNPRIDILLSDVAMPYMGGIQLAESLRQTHPGLQVLLASGLPLKEVTNRREPEFQPEFLAKPFSVSELAGKVRMLAQAA